MLGQYSLFGTLAGLEITALTIFVSLGTESTYDFEKITFSIVGTILVLQITIMLILVDGERRMAWNSSRMKVFQKHKEKMRNLLIYSFFASWSLILFLLNVRIWRT